MFFLAVTAQTWIITGLGFGIVLALLFCLVFILQFFGWTMQKATAPRAPKPENKPVSAPEKSVAPSATQASEDEKAAIAMALYLSQCQHHDLPSSVLHLHAHSTDWNEHSIGLNNKGF